MKEESKGNNFPLNPYRPHPEQGGNQQDSPFYQSAAPEIALPKGGAAMQAIDEKFSVNAVNGTAGMEIPLPLSPNRQEFTPSLSLQYSSGNGNSVFGQGWQLALPSLQRKTDRRLPQYHDAAESDVFLLSGAEDLVPQLKENGTEDCIELDKYSIKRYRPRIEGLFARIEQIKIKKTGIMWWRVTTKDNITTWYGLDAASRIADPDNPRRIYQWLPTLSIDNKGNSQQYHYIQENLDNVPKLLFENNRLNGHAVFTNTYLKKVSYGNTTPYFLAAQDDVFKPELPETDWLFELLFDYGDHSTYAYEADQIWPCRKDAFSYFKAGFEIRTYRKCERILMFHQMEELREGRPTLVRSLELRYQNDALSEHLQASDFLLKAVRKGYQWTFDEQVNAWQVKTKSMPALHMEYSAVTWDFTIQTVAKEEMSGAPQGLTGPYQWIDFEGEGLNGILTEQGNAWYYKNNLGKARFSPTRRIAQKPNATGLGSKSQWQDLDADGSRQLVVQEAGQNGYWELEPTQDAYLKEGKWMPFRSFENQVNIDWNSPHTLRLDLDGDGRSDTLIAGDRVWTWYANKGRKGMENGGQVLNTTEEEKGPVLLLRDQLQSVFLADMSGDGLTDIVRIRNGEVCYWPNLGYGRFGAKVSMLHAPYFQAADKYHPQYLSLADIRGTGTADLIYIGKENTKIWLNLAGNGFSEAVLVPPMPSTDTYSKIAVLDFLGNGTSCLVWSSPLPHHSASPIRYIDLLGGKKPYLLKTLQNGMGKEISLEYKSSTHYYLEDKKQGIYWATKLPFPVHCVHKVINHDIVSETTYTQSYKYRHGYYDSPEREFRGFGYVETLDTESAALNHLPLTINNSLDQAPVLTKTWYHTGAWMRLGDLIKNYQKEYFPFEDWDALVKTATFPKNLSWQENREAHRALKGSVLRQEVYALDGSDKENIPYTVTAKAYKILNIQGLPEHVNKGESGLPPFAVFMNLEEQSVVFSCERKVEDVRIAQELILETDDYGNVLKSAYVVYPRKNIPLDIPVKVQEEQGKMHISVQENHFTNDAIDDTDYLYYRLRTAYAEKAWQLHPENSPAKVLYSIKELLQEVNDAVAIGFTIQPEAGEKRLLSFNKTLFYNNLATNALAEGMLESLAIAYESYTLAFTPDILTESYGTRVDNTMLENGGYIDLDNDDNYWLSSGKAVYDNPKAKFYTAETFLDPWGNATTVSYGNNGYWLLPEVVTDAKSNINTIEVYDWHSLQALRMKDANDNISEIRYDALGLAIAMAVKGKDDGTQGDTLEGLEIDSDIDLQMQEAFWNDPENYAEDLLQGATWRCVYDLESMPVAVAMIGREEHHYESLGLLSKTLIQFVYSDGLGREIMQKVQCEPFFNNEVDKGATLSLVEGWIGTGRTIYNNKGKPVMQFEPYFSDSHHCDTAEQAAADGASPKLYYDPLDRNYRTELPDGSYTKTEWTAWEQRIWDNNDTVLESAWYLARKDGQMGIEEKDAADKAAEHANTPTIIHTDSLGRDFYTIQDDGINPLISSHEVLDIQGNRLAVVDGRGLTPLTYHYNMLQSPCYQDSIDSGTQRTLVDAAGQPLYAWDAEDRKTEIIYDELRRPLKRITNDKELERYIYGEGLVNDKVNNLRGQLYQHYDGSGLQQINIYDFKENALETQQQLLEDATISDADWSSNPVLSAEVFTSAITYDALNRPITQTDPGGNVQAFIYDKGGLLKSIKLNNENYVNDIHYDAKGQRQAIWYGNGTKTSYTYDTFTFRLRRLITVNLNTNDILQDLNYWYDPVGNITEIQDDAQQTLFFNNSVVNPTQKFTYDAIYRLIEAKGRELIGTNFGSEDNWNDATWKTNHKGDGNAVHNYTQKYSYDEVGNILQLQHIANAGSYTRNYSYDVNSNKLLSTEVGSNTYKYSHDVRGNMTAMPHLSAMKWNTLNELESIMKGSEPTYYQYSNGERIRKHTVKGNIKEDRIYLGSYEIYRKYVNNVLDIERTTVHVSDDTGRIAMLEVRTVGTDSSPASLQRYIYSNHLQSASLELDEIGAIISYEEYHPYGTTSYQAMNASIHAVAKRYRYTGKERDEESGLYYHGARYYIPWLARWTAVDPLEAEYSPWSPYHYVKCNPIMDTDSTGMGGDEDPPKGYYKVGGMWDSFDEEGNNKYGQLGGWVDINGTGDYKYYTNEEYLHKFGGNEKFRPNFSGTVDIAGKSSGINNGRILHHDGTIEKTRTYGSTSVPSKEIKPKPTITTIQEESKTIENIELTKIPIDEKQETVLQANGGNGFWSGVWNTTEGMLENAASSVTLTVTGVIMPVINQFSVIANEGFHSGSAWYQESKVSWAVPYKVKNWKFVRQDQMMGQTLSWEDGKEVMKSTTNTLFLITPIKHNIPIPGAAPWLQKGVNWGAGWGTKQGFKKGINYWLED